jgi:replicative DNA helicase
LSQISRKAQANESRRRSLSDLFEFSSIEEDADVVILVVRAEHYLKAREPEPGSLEHAKWLEKMERLHRRAELLVEKNRHGANGTIDLYFDERFNRFMNLGDSWSSTTL